MLLDILYVLGHREYYFDHIWDKISNKRDIDWDDSPFPKKRWIIYKDGNHARFSLER
jgi:hypothetical protein